MPYGCYLARCLHCGKQWVVGDCIPSTCPDCQAAGHRGILLDCPKCREPLDRIRAAKLAADNRAKGLPEDV